MRKKPTRGRPALKVDVKFSERFVVLLTPRQKKSVLKQGGSEFVRTIVEDYLRHAAD